MVFKIESLREKLSAGTQTHTCEEMIQASQET